MVILLHHIQQWMLKSIDESEIGIEKRVSKKIE